MELQTIREDTNKVFVINQPMNLHIYLLLLRFYILVYVLCYVKLTAAP